MSIEANVQETAMVAMEENSKFVADLQGNSVTMFCSFKPSTPKQKAQLFKAMNNPDKRIADCINMEINVKDVFCETVNCTNRETGELQECPRIVLIDDKGVGYQCVSLGMFSALKKVMAVFGTPTWETPVKLKIVQITKGERKLLTFDVIV
jgi:hypothetical protein